MSSQTSFAIHPDLAKLLESTEAVLSESIDKTYEDAFSDSDISELDWTEALDDLTTYTDCLMDLTAALENPAIDIDLQGPEAPPKIETFNVSTTMALNYCRKLRDQFEGLDTSLVERFGETNAERSNRMHERLLKATQERNEQIPIPGAPDSPSATSFSKNTMDFTESTRSTALSDSLFDKDSGFRDNASRSSFTSKSTSFSMASMRDLGRPHVPPLPEGAESGTSFECLTCGQQIKASTRSAWK